MININFKTVILWISALLLFGMVGCIDDPNVIGPQGKDRYLDPPWLGGSSIDTLEKNANYSIFLELMDKAKYREPIEKQLFTLFVPNNDAFNAFFQKVGKTGIEDFTEDEAMSLFTLHILTNARSAYQLKYEYQWAELQSPKGEYASLFFRKQTNSTVIPYKETVKYEPSFKGRELTIYGDTRLVSLFSKSFFEDFFGAPDGSDYKILFPESNWADNLNWHNAAVTEAEVRTSSGFIYFIDQVVGPMQSIEEYLLFNQDKFSIFYDITQRFARYINPKRRIEDNTLMYKKSYRLIEDIAEENGPETEYPRNLKGIFSALVPTNDVMQEYLDNTVLKYYPSLDSVPEITLYYIVQSHLIRSLALMSKSEKIFYNAFGDVIDISRNDISTAFMASNGPVYHMKKVLEPNVFTTVPGRLFIDKNYSTFLFTMEAIGLIPLLSDIENNITLFAATNDEMEAANIRYNSIDNIVQTRGTDGQWIPINSDVLLEFLRDHMYDGVIENLNGEGFLKMVSGNYVYYNNGKIEGGKNQLLKEQATITSSEKERNGNLHLVNKTIKTRYGFGEMLMDDPDLSDFAQLLIDAGMLNPFALDQTTLDTIPNLGFIAEVDMWTAFIPTNSAVQNAVTAGIIPTDPEELKSFLTYHFIRRSTIFSDGKLSGIFNSNSIKEVTTQGVVYHTLSVTNNINSLSVTDNSGKTVSINQNNANKLVRKGVIHKITTVLEN